MPHRTAIQQKLIPIAAMALILAIGSAAWASDTITYRLKWLKNMSTAGDLVADTQGFFKNAGLSVVVKAGGPERDALRELELGYADFGVASADQVIRARAKGAPIVVIAQLFQVNPLQWIYRPEAGVIDDPGDLRNKAIGVTFGKNDEIIMRTLLAGAGLTDAAVRLFSVRLDYTPFYKGKVDLWPVYINTQGIEIGGKLARAGVSYRFFDPSRHGVRFVANSVVTSQRMIDNQVPLVKRFLGALLQGWRNAMHPDNRERTITVVQQFDKDTKRPVLAAQFDATRLLVQPGPHVVIGTIDFQAWQQTEAIMINHGQITKPVDVTKVLIQLGNE